MAVSKIQSQYQVGDLLSLCKNKVLSGTPTALPVHSNRLTVINGGYVTENGILYIYCEATDNFPSWGVATTIRSMAVFSSLPTIASGDFQNPCSSTAYHIDEKYQCPLAIYNHSTYGTVGQLIIPKNKQRLNGGKWLIYGMYLLA